jgi:oxygen-dependent protoporphyrinogen oxidase
MPTLIPIQDEPEGAVILGCEHPHGRRGEVSLETIGRFVKASQEIRFTSENRQQRIAERVAALPGLRLAGNAYDGIGIPDCIRLGRQAAKELLRESR